MKKLTVGGRQLMVDGGRLTVDGEQTPTQKLWGDEGLQARHVLELKELSVALIRGNIGWASNVMTRIEQIEAEQAQAHQAVRRYLLEGVRHG
jgi:hypothetical protein